MVLATGVDGKAVNVAGQLVSRPKAQGYNLRIGNVWYRTIANPAVPLTIGTRDSLAERQDRAGSIYENVLDIGYAWSRTDLSGGEGLDWDPRELALFQDQAALDQLRYFESNNLYVGRPDTNGEQYRLRLSRAAVDWEPVFVDPKDMANSAHFVYVADGSLVAQYESWVNVTPTASWDIGVEIVALAVSPNDTIMVTDIDGAAWVKRSTDLAFEEFYPDTGQQLDAKGVWFVHGRFMLSTWNEVDNAVLYSVNWVAADWLTILVDSAASRFVSIVESGPAVVAACVDGTVRTYTPDISTDGDYELIPKGRTTMPDGEQPILLGSNAGVLLIMTTSDTVLEGDIGEGPETLQGIRLYQAEVLDARFDFIVGQIQLRRTWFATRHEPDEARNMASTRDEILWFVREYIDGEFSEALWRFDVITNGLSRVGTYPGRNLNALIVFDSVYAGIDFETLKVVITDLDKYQDMGWMVFPNITFGLNTPITWMSTIVEVQGLAETGTQVELWRSSDTQALLDWQDPSWILVQRLSNDAATNIEIPMLGVRSRTLALQLRVFNHTEGTGTPEITRTALRGIPAHRDFIMQIPINVSDYVSVPGRSPNKVPGMGHDIHNQVLNLVGQNVQAVLVDPPMLFEGVINNISEPVEYLAERGSVTRYVMVEFRGQRSISLSPSTGDSGVGLGLLGIATVGLGQTGRT